MLFWCREALEEKVFLVAAKQLIIFEHMEGLFFVSRIGDDWVICLSIILKLQNWHKELVCKTAVKTLKFDRCILLRFIILLIISQCRIWAFLEVSGIKFDFVSVVFKQNESLGNIAWILCFNLFLSLHSPWRHCQCMVQLLWIAIFKNYSGKNWNFSSSSPFLSKGKYLSVFFLPWTGLLTTSLDFVGLLNTLMFSNKHILHVQVWKFSVVLSVMWMSSEVLSAFLIRLLAFVKQCWMRCFSCFLLVWSFFRLIGAYLIFVSE